MTELSERIAKLSPEQRALLERRLTRSANAPTATDREPIAIVGAACRFPGEANDLDSFWRLLREGRDGITPVPPERWNAAVLFDSDPTAAGRISSRWGGFISNVDRFDADFFGISPREAMEMDPQQRILLEVAFDALEHAGLPRDGLAGGKMGVFVGVHGHASDYLFLQNENLDGLDGFSGTGTAHNLLAGRLSYILDTHGPALVVDTACSSSLVAVHLAVQSLRLNECSSALVGGVNLILTPNFTIAASRMHMLAPDGRCKAFDARADGFVRSEGCGVVVLKRLSDAVADRDAILAVIRGSAINQDGHTNGITAPNGLAQRQVIENALADAAVSGHSIGFVEAHGTGTALGDPIELEALGATIGKQQTGADACFVGSVKTNIGHLEGAAGVAGLIKAALALHHGEIPPNLHFTSLNPHIRIGGTRLIFPSSAERWSTAEPRRASVSSFGWSGTNAHVILEEAPARPPSAAPKSPIAQHVLTLSARSAEALAAIAQLFRNRLSDNGSVDLDDLCFTAAMRRSHYGFRLAVVGSSAAEIGEEIELVLKAGLRQLKPVKTPRVAFIFPGHGAQWVGMGRKLLETEPVFRDVMMSCDAAINQEAGWSLLEEIQAPDESSRLGSVEIAQPTLFAFGIALAGLWKSWGILPDAVLGHSMGEVAAAHIAGAISLADATRIICRRSKLLQQVAERGAMMVVELSADEAQQAIDEFEGKIVIGAVNGPRTSVLSGDRLALERVAQKLVPRNVYCRIVEGSPAGHSHLVEPLKGMLLDAIAAIKPVPVDVPIYSTVTACAEGGELFDPNYWVRNFREPVRFLDAVLALIRDEFDVLLEVSPHPILSSVIQDIVQTEPPMNSTDPTNRGVSNEVITLPSLRRNEQDHDVLYSSLARLYQHGASIRWERVVSRGRIVPLPSYVWQRQRYWLSRTSSRRDQHFVSSAVAGHGAIIDQQSTRKKVADWLYDATWLEAALPPRKPDNGRWILLAKKEAASANFAIVMSAQLRSHGNTTQIIFIESDFADSLDKARLGGGPWNGVIHCAALDAKPTSEITATSLVAEPIPGGASLLEVIRSFDSRDWPGEPKLWIVTRGATVVHDEDREALMVAQAPVRGLARVVETEHPTRYGGCIDLDASASLAKQASELEADLEYGSDEPAIAYRGGKRYIQRLIRLASVGDGQPVNFRPDASYLITGGLGGVGLFVARWMVARGARHILILGQMPLPPRAQWHQLKYSRTSSAERVAAICELEALGAAVHYFPVDVSDASALNAVLDQWNADARPPIRGVIHTAAVLEFELLTRLDQGLIDRVFGAKAVGAWLLSSVMANADWFVFFSSVASILPQSGGGAYAAANAFLDALSQHKGRIDKPALSVGWGVWNTDVGVLWTPGLRQAKERLQEQGISGFSPDDGLSALELLLGTRVSYAAVFNADRDQFIRYDSGVELRPLLRGFKTSTSETNSQSDGAIVPFVAEYSLANLTQRTTLLQERIVHHVATVLKLTDRRIDVQKPLGEYGLNSIMGLELRHRLEREFALRLSATLIWNYPSVVALAAYLAERIDENLRLVEGSSDGNEIGEANPVPIASASRTDRAESRVSQVRNISDDEALRAIRGRGE